MAYNSVLTPYTAHLASPVEPEIDDACTAVADMLKTVLAELPLHRPLKGASPVALAVPPDVPWLFVLPGAGPNTEEKLDQVRVGDWHALDLLFIFGVPFPVDTQLKPNLDYLYATKLAISENRNIGDGVNRLGVTGWDWRPKEFAGKVWSGLEVNVRLQIIYKMRAAW